MSIMLILPCKITTFLFIICFTTSFFYNSTARSSFDPGKCSSEKSARYSAILDRIIKSSGLRADFNGETIINIAPIVYSQEFCKINMKYLQDATTKEFFTLQYPDCFEQSDREESVNWFKSKLPNEIQGCKDYYKE